MLRTSDKRLFLGEPLSRIMQSKRASFDTETCSGADSGSLAITSGASANAKGNPWTEVIAETAFDADGFLFQSVTGTATERDTLMDIGVGAASSEVVILPDWHIMAGADSMSGVTAYIPIPIAKGSRIAARSQASTGSTANGIAITLCRGEWARRMRMRKCTMYGHNAADSGGVGIDPGGSANTESGWQEITSATTAPGAMLYVFVGRRARADASVVLHKVDIALGAGGAEVAIIEDLCTRASTNSHQSPIWFGPIPVDIPTGSRISARAMSSATDANDRLLDVIVGVFSP